MSADKSDQDTLWDLIKGIKFGMLTHRHRDGAMHGHPMTTQNQSIDHGKTLYFFLSEKSGIPGRLREDSSVNIAYADPGADTYISVSGTAKISDDQATKERLWTSMAQAWFPGGVNDPDVALLMVEISEAEYWNVKDSKVTQLFKMATSAMSGQTPQHMGDHKKVNVS